MSGAAAAPCDHEDNGISEMLNLLQWNYLPSDFVLCEKKHLLFIQATIKYIFCFLLMRKYSSDTQTI